MFNFSLNFFEKKEFGVKNKNPGQRRNVFYCQGCKVNFSSYDEVPTCPRCKKPIEVVQGVVTVMKNGINRNKCFPCGCNFTSLKGEKVLCPNHCHLYSSQEGKTSKRNNKTKRWLT